MLRIRCTTGLQNCRVGLSDNRPIGWNFPARCLMTTLFWGRVADTGSRFAFLRSFYDACAYSSCGTWFWIALLQEFQHRCPGLFRFLARCLCLAVLFRGCWFARRQRCSWLEKTSRRLPNTIVLTKSQNFRMLFSFKMFDASGAPDGRLASHQVEQTGAAILD